VRTGDCICWTAPKPLRAGWPFISTPRSCDGQMIADSILQRAISRLVGRGTLRIITGSGACLEAGDGGDPQVSIRLIGRAATWSLVIDPELTLGELYTDGRLLIEQGTIFDLFQLLLETRHCRFRRSPVYTSWQSVSVAKSTRTAPNVTLPIIPRPAAVRAVSGLGMAIFLRLFRVSGPVFG
jgi:hypothetical protein